MSESDRRRFGLPTFSLLHLLILTALIAVGVAIGMAYQKNRSLISQRDELLSLANRLDDVDEGKLVAKAMPRVAEDFFSWHVYVPDDDSFELRLGLGVVSTTDIPSIVGHVLIPAGRHRVTLFTGDTIEDEFTYRVYVDGRPVIEKTMGSDWVPGGWSSASGLNWPRGEALSPEPLQLKAENYIPRHDFGRGNYFNGRSDDYVTRNGYRLWIDQRDRLWKPASPFIGIEGDPTHYGIGLRDGLRYKSLSLPGYDWAFSRPRLESTEAVWKIAAEFFAEDGTQLSSSIKTARYWKLVNDKYGAKKLNWNADPNGFIRSAFLQANADSTESVQPTVEVQWDAGRPDEVALRIADTSTNDQIRRWRLRVVDGRHHLWREMQIGDRKIHADELVENRVAGSGDQNGQPNDTKAARHQVLLDLQDDKTDRIFAQWQTDVDVPLQVLERREKDFAGMGLFKGLPLTFGIEIPASLKPKIIASTVAEDPGVPGQPFPGGTVFNEIQFDLDATNHDWIWLRTTPKLADVESVPRAQ